MNQQREGKDIEAMHLMCCYRSYKQLEDTFILAQVCFWATVTDEHVVGSVHAQ